MTPEEARNPYLAPLWVACGTAIAVSMPLAVATGTLWGLAARWNRRVSRTLREEEAAR